jgi:hypothetical protein
LAAKSPMLEDRPHANAGFAGFFYTLRLDKTMIDRISIPHLIFEDTYPLLLNLGKIAPSRARHFREYATVSLESMPWISRIIGILGAWALREKAPWKFGMLVETKTAVGISVPKGVRHV